jgi:amino acid efflux transporter
MVFLRMGGHGTRVVGLTGAAYLVKALSLPDVFTYLIAIAFMGIALLTNAMGMRISGMASLLLSGLVLAMLLITIAFALPDIQVEQFKPFAPHGISGIGRACVLIFWAFFGWESITHLVPEFRNPQRDVMRSTWASVFVIGAVYVMLSFVTVGTHTYGVEGAAAPLTELMSKTIGLSAGIATAIVACIVCLGTLNVYLAGSSRLGYALAKERKLPDWFARMSRNGFPYRTAVFFFVTNTVVLIVSYLWKIDVDTLILIPTTLGIFVYIIASFACVKLLWHDRIGRAAALTAAVFCLAVAPFATSYLAVPVVVAIGCLVYLYYRKIRKDT